VGFSPSERLETDEDYALTIRNLTLDDSGNYTCLVLTSNLTTSSSGYLKVLELNTTRKEESSSIPWWVLVLVILSVTAGLLMASLVLGLLFFLARTCFARIRGEKGSYDPRMGLMEQARTDVVYRVRKMSSRGFGRRENKKGFLK